MKDIRTIVQGIARLKPIPQALHKIMRLAQENAADTQGLSSAIAQDPALTANLLKDANSAYYGRPGKFETVNQAVVFLGTIEVINLVLMAGCRQTLSAENAGYDLGAGELWRNSLCSALMAQAIATRRRLDDRQLIFTVGILKDIGKVVLSQFVAEHYASIRRLVDEGGRSFREAEKAVLGIDHAELGAMVAQVWQFSPKTVDMIRHHHQPMQCKLAPHAAAAVYMGDILCMMLGEGVGADGLAYRFQRQAIDLLALSDSDVQTLLIEFEAQMDRLSGLLDAGASGRPAKA